MPTFEVTSTAELESALEEIGPGATFVLGDGTYQPNSSAGSLAAAIIVRSKDVTFRAAPGARPVLHGSRLEFGLLGQPGCDGLTWDGIGVTQAGHGICFRSPRSIIGARLLNGWGWGCGAEVVNTARTQRLLVDGWDLSGWDPKKPGRDNWIFQDDRGRDFYKQKRHGIYVASAPKDTTLRNIVTHDLWGQGIYLSGSPQDGTLSQGATIEDFTVRRCHLADGSGGPGVQLTSCRGTVLRRGLIAECRGGLTLYAEGNRRLATQGTTLEDVTIYQPDSLFAVNVMDGSHAPELQRVLIVGPLQGVAAGGFPGGARKIEEQDPGGLVDDALRSLVQGVGWRPAGVPPPPPIPDPTDPDLRATVTRLLADNERLTAENRRLVGQVAGARLILAQTAELGEALAKRAREGLA